MIDQITQSTVSNMPVGTAATVSLVSLLVWTTEATFLYLVAQALAVPLPYAGAFFLLFALGLSVALPQAPGYIGTFEFFGVTALALLGIPKEHALPVMLTIHSVQFVMIACMGMVALWHEGLSLKSLSSFRYAESKSVSE